MKNSNNQIPDDNKLLARMMEDCQKADKLYRPTNYWSHYQKFFLPELQKEGLRDFRRRKESILSSFGATDLLPYIIPRFEESFYIKGMYRGIRLFLYILEKLRIKLLMNYSPEEINKYFFEYTREKFKKLYLDIFRCPTNDYGNPEDITIINRSLWSLNHIQTCSIYADAARYIEFKPDMVFCELGPGLGRNVEILAKLYNDATFLLFDIPPQLYVANQYLLTLFKQRVLSYEEAFFFNLHKQGGLPDKAKGKILILPTWKMPEWTNVKIDIFWNSESFQEMEPEIVKNYLELVKKQRPTFIYINAMPQGNYWGEWKAGQGGTKSPVLEKYYFDSLNKQYSLVGRYYTDYFLKKREYVSYIFKIK